MAKQSQPPRLADHQNTKPMELVISLPYDESVLIHACVQQERWAQQALYEAFYSPMMGICLRYANDENEALDMLHEGFIKVFKHIGKYQPGTSLIAWTRRIMVNTAIDHFRKQQRRQIDDLEEARHVQTLDPDAVSKCTEQEILQAVQQLSPMYRAVFNLYVIEGFSHQEIADQLGITESTSRSNLVKARLKLQQFLTRKGN